MMRAAVLGSPISHSLSPLLHNTAYSILGITGEYSAIDVPSANFADFLSHALGERWRGFNLTMPLKESVFDTALVHCDEASTRIRSANTLIREGSGFAATSTDLTAFARLLSEDEVERVAIIGGGGTARAAIGALADRIKSIDLLLRTPSRIDAIARIAPGVEVAVKAMDSSLNSYDLVINTTPAGVADHFAQNLDRVDGLYFESLYNPWPTELSFAWKELGGQTLHGVDLLVEQALDAIALMTEKTFDYSDMRNTLLAVAISSLDSQRA
jgi:shikimate dehydrogenase